MRRATLAAATGAAIGAAVVGADAAMRRWEDAEDPCGPEGLDLPPGREHRVTTDDGADLGVHASGPVGGPAVVLVHCWTGHRGFWGAVARQLVADGHRVVLYDQRGHGTSTMGDERPSVERLGTDLRQVLEALDVSDAVLAGHSMGGMAVQALAIEHPEVVAERARGIVLVATASRVVARPIPPAVANLLTGGGLARRPGGRAGLAFIRPVVGRAPRLAHVTATRDAFEATSAEVRAGFLVAMSHMDLRDGLAEVDLPVKVLVGTQDRLTPPRLARRLAASVPGAELVVLPGAGHMLPLEEPDRVTQAILETHRAAPDSRGTAATG
jgi:pimeloyl-ACP methyl ester carboxylesterase